MVPNVVVVVVAVFLVVVVVVVAVVADVAVFTDIYPVKVMQIIVDRSLSTRPLCAVSK
jgi:hypothetical protein